MRSVPRLATVAALVFVTGAFGATATGCARDSGPTITHESQAAEDTTSTLTPLERGELRREVLQTMQDGIDAWIANDTDAMALVFDDASMQLFRKTWDEYAARGLTVVHVHESLFFDVTELNNSGTQAIVQYQYNDNSYLVDETGSRVEDLTPLTEIEPQFTLEKQEDGSWKVIRAIANADSYR